MTKKRNRNRPLLSLQERLKHFAEDARKTAKELPPGPQRERLIHKALSNDAAAKIERWLSSPGLQSPK
jgi:hypothetical protein